MDQLRPRLPFCSIFYDCKLLEMLYLFVSQQSVNLRGWVMLTDKSGHFVMTFRNETEVNLIKGELKVRTPLESFDELNRCN